MQKCFARRGLPLGSVQTKERLMSQPIDEILAFFTEWNSMEAMYDSLRRRFTAATVWENVGFAKTTGAEEAVAFMQAFDAQMKLARGEVITHHIAAAGNVVLTERTDIFYDRAGKAVLTIPLMGIFEMDGPHVLAWRDYFDVNMVQAQMAPV
jgi:limonene-1,2-epoxide hydrolase